jgi:sulfite exporter TauE/SafE
MNQYFVAFITGLTTGGLSCLAVQGGLLASSLERQMEQDLLKRPSLKGKKRARVAQQARSRMALPILLFLGAKILAYTMLGFLLGALGSVLKLNTTMRAVFLVAVGIFMVGNALRILNVHPIFRYFVIEPPKFITRYIRRTSKDANGTQTNPYIAPLFLGALTVLIPCGVTQAMMAVAIGTSDPWQAAGLMLAFTLGTSPVFFFVSYLATELGARMESIFMRLVAAVVLILGLVSVDSGLALMGAPSLTSWTQSLMDGQQVSEASIVGVDGGLVLNVGNNGYSPRTLHAKADAPLKLNMVTKNTYSCARAFVIPALNVEELLPANGTVVINIPAQKAGTVMPFTCSMGMYTGEIIFDQ